MIKQQWRSSVGGCRGNERRSSEPLERVVRVVLDRPRDGSGRSWDVRDTGTRGFRTVRDHLDIDGPLRLTILLLVERRFDEE